MYRGLNLTFYIYPHRVYTNDMNEALKKRTSHRTNIIKGQIEGLQKMIETDTYCMDILTQSLAIQRSLASLSKLVLENHISTHITHMLGSADKAEREKAQQELLSLYELNNIRGK